MLADGIDRESGYYQLGADFAWELDLWGRVRRSVESARAAYQAQEEAYRDTLVTQLGLLYQNRYSHADTADWRLTNRNHVLVYDTAGRFWYAPDRVRAGQGNVDGAVPLRDANGNVIAYPTGRGEGGVLNTFTDTVTVRETSPLDAGASLKHYARGVGMIFDDGVELQPGR